MEQNEGAPIRRMAETADSGAVVKTLTFLVSLFAGLAGTGGISDTMAQAPSPDTTGIVAGAMPVVGATVLLCVVAVGFVVWRLNALRESRQQLKESENLVRLLLESVTVGYGMEDIDGRTLHPNEGLARLLGYTPEELQAMHFTDYTAPEFVDEDKRLFRQLVAGEIDRYAIEKRYRSKNGKEVWGRVTRSLLRDRNGRPERCFGVLTDITDRKKAENALAAREAQLTALIDGAPVGVFFKDKESRYLIVNQTYCDFHGLDRETVIGRRPADFQRPEHARNTMMEDRQVLEDGGILSAEETLVSRDGVARQFSLSKFPVTDAEGHLLGLGGMLIEITDVKSAERYAVELSTRMHRILNSAGEGICELDMTGAVTFINETGAAILGWTPAELTGRKLHDVVHATKASGEVYATSECPACRAISTATEFRAADEMFWRRNGEGISVSLLATPISVAGTQTGVVLVFEDITERLSMEKQLRQAQKLEAIGQLTGGVAHDFNNLLQVVAANLELAESRLPDDHIVRPLLISATQAVQRGGNLTQKLLAFSRKQALRPEISDPWRLVDGMHTMLARILGEDIDIETVFEGRPATITVDTHEFENALLNLTLNARSAMPKGGKLTLAVTVKQFEQGIRADDEILPPGPYVAISVSDTGCGMSEEVRHQAFEPFFTTKDVGEGSGLGLSMVYGFARQSGGEVSIESEQGKGTTVRIFLPARLEEEAIETMETKTTADQHVLKVLLVEDDADVRETTVMLLKTLGCEVREAEDATPVLDILREDENIDLLLSDVVLPGGTNGIELAQKATQLRPELRVILVSGYPEAALEKAGLRDTGFAMLAKPYSPLHAIGRPALGRHRITPRFATLSTRFLPAANRFGPVAMPADSVSYLIKKNISG